MEGVTNIDDGLGGSWKSRNCLSFGEYTRSWSFKGTRRVLVRRFCMWATIILRIGMNILAIFFDTLGSKIASIVCGVLFGILSFVFVIWCLTMIDRAHGHRACWFCGLLVGRTHLDIFVGVSALLHVAFLASLWEIANQSSIGFHIIFFGLCVLIGIYGFLCTKPPIPV